MGETLELESFEPLKILGDEDTAVTLGRSAWKVNKTGKRVEEDWVHIFSFRGDQIAAFHEMADTWTAAQAFIED